MIQNSIKRQIAEALTLKLKEISEIKYVRFDEIKISLDDFLDSDLPAIQIMDTGTTITHQRTQLEKVWSLDIELILKSNVNQTINQLDLWDYEATIERKIGENVTLSIPKVRHIRYIANRSDLHFTGPHYTARLSFEVLFTEPYTAEC